MTRLLRWLAALALALAVGVGVVPDASALPAPRAADCPGVWVVVADVGVACAAEHDTGREALTSAGFTSQESSPGMLCRIEAQPATCTVTADAYWSYWQASRNPDGTWADWAYSPLGYASSAPEAGAAEGWSFGDGSVPPPPPPGDGDAVVAPAPSSVNDPATTPGATGVLVTLGILVIGGAALLVWRPWRVGRG